MAPIDRDKLLSCFTAHVAWAERPCVQRTWRTLRGEAPLGSSALPKPPASSTAAAGSSSFTGVGRIFGLHNFDAGGLLGDGNYSQVIQATVRPTQEQVALKIVDKAKMNRYHKADEVIVEKYVLTHADHPSIIRLYHTFQDASALYLCLELVPGGELWALCHRRGIHTSHAAYFVSQLCEALQHLHERRIVHRDVKPENVLLTAEGRLKLIDFGSAKLMDAVETDSPLRASLCLADPFKDFVGTAEYMAPEAIDNKGGPPPRHFLDTSMPLPCHFLDNKGGPPPRPQSRSPPEALTRLLAQQAPTGARTSGPSAPSHACSSPASPPSAAAPTTSPSDASRLASSTCPRGCRPTPPTLSTSSSPPTPTSGSAAARHGALLDHPFFGRHVGGSGGAGAQPRGSLHQRPLPIPRLAELCLEPVCTRLTQGGWARAAIGGPPASRWPDAVCRALVFELARKRALTDELRQLLRAGPPPPPIDDDALIEAARNEAGEEESRPLGTRPMSQALPAELAAMDDEEELRQAEAGEMFGESSSDESGGAEGTLV